MKGTYLLFDIGATKIRLAVSKNGQTFGKPVIFKTPKKISHGLDLIVSEAKKLCGGKILAAAGGIAGPLNTKKTMTINTPNLPGWSGKPLVESLQKILKTKVILENDAAVVGLGEACYGAGKGKSIVVYYTLSTGVNGVRIVNGKIDPSAFGFEVGFQLINSKSLQWHIGGNELKSRFGKAPEDITSQKVWKNATMALAVGLNNTIVHWSPEVIVFGGSVMNKISILQVKKELKKVLKIFPRHPEIKKAALGDIGGLYGALALIRSRAL